MKIISYNELLNKNIRFVDIVDDFNNVVKFEIIIENCNFNNIGCKNGVRKISRIEEKMLEYYLVFPLDNNVVCFNKCYISVGQDYVVKHFEEDKEFIRNNMRNIAVMGCCERVAIDKQYDDICISLSNKEQQYFKDLAMNYIKSKGYNDFVDLLNNYKGE